MILPANEPTVQTPDLNLYFLPYQLAWLADMAKIKIWEKSRRVGATYVQSFEDVRDILLKIEYTKGRPVRKVYYMSLSEANAKEYIEYCARWAKLLSILVKLKNGEQDFDEDDGTKSKIFTIDFPNGGQINALSGNPDRFHGMGGKVVLDEFGRKKDQYQTWKSANPVIMWGFPLRIISTHKGKQSQFYHFCEDTRAGKTGWSIHTVPIQAAVAQGLYDRIQNRVTTEEERAAWIAELELLCQDRDTYLEEYCCIAVDSATAFLTYDIIKGSEDYNLLMTLDELALLTEGDLYAGWDNARKRDFSVFWLLQKLGSVRYTRLIMAFEKTPFDIQREFLAKLMRLPRMRRICIDATGMGIVLTEDAVKLYGTYRVEGVTFTGPVKEEMGYYLKSSLTDRNLRIPPEDMVRESFHSIVKTVTSSGNIRLDADHSDATGHADHFWACALAENAAKSGAGPVTIQSRKLDSRPRAVRAYMPTGQAFGVKAYLGRDTSQPTVNDLCRGGK